ncbi:sensor histidine kinase [Paenibacillus sp. B2(2019)]|uniref:sensor histidine kinase n=1 Tax=Paenibacillus sp. B2(2019) TaxID=2607754 RepID=UPI0011F12DD5|nr:hypothetical protein [Paenibacillus sp. B2(2019)]KAA1177499.1 hypothetical protein PAENI_30300 [Paenibacillus sp. B2(2019)]
MENLFEHSSGYWTEDIEGNKSLMLIRNTTITLFAIMVTLMILFTSAMTIRTNRPILALVKFIKEVGNGNLNLRLKRKSTYEEFSVLNRGINDMLDKINELTEESVKRQLLQKEAEYDAPQSKMDPHFLYAADQSDY